MKKAIWYLIVFLIVEVFVGIISGLVFPNSGEGDSVDREIIVILLSSVVSGIIVMALFFWRRWCPVSLNYIKSRPLKVLLWTVVVALASLVPSVWLVELLPEQYIQNNNEALFELIMRDGLGYVIVGLVAPIVEEVVFRGAILRALLAWSDQWENKRETMTWAMISLSAIIFALVHANPAQMPHAFLIGILLGWLYYRTGSIVPGVLFHWVNNTAAMLLAYTFPDVPVDANLDAYFGGSQQAVMTAVIVSLIVFIPGLWRLNKLMKKAPNTIESSDSKDVFQ